MMIRHLLLIVVTIWSNLAIGQIVLPDLEHDSLAFITRYYSEDENYKYALAKYVYGGECGTANLVVDISTHTIPDAVTVIDSAGNTVFSTGYVGEPDYHVPKPRCGYLLYDYSSGVLVSELGYQNPLPADWMNENRTKCGSIRIIIPVKRKGDIVRFRIDFHPKYDTDISYVAKIVPNDCGLDLNKRVVNTIPSCEEYTTIDTIQYVDGCCHVTEITIYEGMIKDHFPDDTISMCTGSEYIYRFGDDSVIINSPGLYEVPVVINGCTADYINLTVNSSPVYVDTTVYYDDVQTNYKFDYYYYSYDIHPGHQIIKDSYRNGCKYEINLTAIVANMSYYIPNVFSPNGDGINDVFKVYNEPGVPLICEISIYDRWGDILITGSSEWAPDSSVPVGVYVYKITIRLPNGVTKMATGDVTLMR